MVQYQNGQLHRSKAKILLVDDRADKLLALETVLSSIDAEIIKAISGREALRCMLQHNFALVLLDVNMPGMDGFETASLIRARPKSQNTPIIFITSINTNENHISQGYSLGAVDYIYTPVIPEILKTKVSVFIDLYAKNELVRIQSENMAQEAALRAEGLETRLRRLLNQLDVGVFRATLEGQILEANPALLRIFAVNSVAELPTQHVAAICNSTHAENESQEVGRQAIDIQLQDALGNDKWISLTRTIISDEGDLPFIKGLVEDITLRKRGEQELKQLNETLEIRVRERTEALRISQEHLSRAQRLASLGTLAAGIAHEINNPLNAILMLSEYAIKNQSRELSQKTLKTIAEQTRRCGKIISGVLQFARNEKTIKSPYDLNDVIAHSVDFARTYVNTPLKVTLDLAKGPITVLMNATEMEQVVVNLIQNAAEASPDGAEMTVRTRCSGQRVLVTFQDCGPGISAEIIDNIFDPFFSTHRGEGGTGLGLSVVHGIISGHNGELKVESIPGKGALFTIDLPLVSSRSPETVVNNTTQNKANQRNEKTLIHVVEN